MRLAALVGTVVDMRVLPVLVLVPHVLVEPPDHPRGPCVVEAVVDGGEVLINGKIEVEEAPVLVPQSVLLDLKRSPDPFIVLAGLHCEARPFDVAAAAFDELLQPARVVRKGDDPSGDHYR